MTTESIEITKKDWKAALAPTGGLIEVEKGETWCIERNDMGLAIVAGIDVDSEGIAKLMAAAPDLLRECLKAWHLVSKLQFPTEQELHDLSDSLGEAIDKANGK